MRQVLVSLRPGSHCKQMAKPGLKPGPADSTD